MSKFEINKGDRFRLNEQGLKHRLKEGLKIYIIEFIITKVNIDLCSILITKLHRQGDIKDISMTTAINTNSIYKYFDLVKDLKFIYPDE